MKRVIVLVIIMVLATPFTLSAQINAPIKTPPKNDKTIKVIDPNQGANKVQIVNYYELKIKDHFPRSPAVARLDDGRFFATWEELLLPADKKAGTAMLFAENMQAAHTPLYFTQFMPEAFIGKSQVIPFSDGNTLVLYENEKDYKTRFLVFDSKFNIIKGPVLINGGAGAIMMSAARLSGGKLAVIGFHTLGGTLGGFGKITVVNSAGEIILQPATFTDKGLIDSLSVAVLPNGLIVLGYSLGFARSVVMDQAGNIIRPESVFYSNTTSCVNAIPLDKGNVMMVFKNQFSRPVCQLLDAQGNRVGSFKVIQDIDVDGLRAVKLINGKVLVCFNKQDSVGVSGLTLAVLDQTGSMVKGPTIIQEGYGTVKDLYTIMPVREDLAFVFMGCWLRKEGQPQERKNGFWLVK